MARYGTTLLAAGALLLICWTRCPAEPIVTVAHNDNNHADRRFKFDTVPPPSRDDAAIGATFTRVFGNKDDNAGDVDRLHDGKVPDWEDQPPKSFVFASGEGGRLLVDLGRAIDVARVNTYSWHPSTRGPQVYKLYLSDGTAPNFNSKPAKGTDPTTCGWTFAADVDTRPKQGDPGGQYAVSISDTTGSLGHDRYLLFDIARTESDDDWGNTMYSAIDVIERGTEPTPVEAYLSPTDPRDAPGDPMDWKPPVDPPDVRARYGDEAYRKLAKAARAKVDLSALRDPGRPFGGVLVQEVLPDSPAELLGIHSGDILMAIDGTPIGSHGADQDMNAARNGQAQQLTFWSPRAGQRTVTIQAGKIGVRCYAGPRLAETYARSAQRDASWDDDMLVACSTYMTDPLLAETALFHARKAGFVGTLFTPLASRIAFNECQFADALAYGWPDWSASRKLSRDTVKTYHTAALLGFKLEQALDLSKRYPLDLPKDDAVSAMVAAYRAMPKSNLSNPMAELENVRRTRTHRYTAFAPNLDRTNVPESEWAASHLNDNQVMSLNVPSGSYASMLLVPGFANVSLAAHFDVHDSDRDDTGFGRAICFGLFDMTRSMDQGPMPVDAIKVTLLTDGPIGVAAFGLPETRFALPRPAAAGTRLEGTIHIVVLHNRCEVTLDDGRRIFYGPVTSDESKRRYGFFIQAVGVSGDVPPPVWERLEDLRAAAIR